MATVKVLKDSGRQYSLTAVQKITVADHLDGTLGTLTLELPADAFIVAAALIVTTAFNTGTTHTLSIGHSGSATFYLGATDLKTAARTSFTAGALAAVTTATTGVVLFTSTPVGTAPTTGEAYIVVEYVVKGRANENQD